MPRALRSSSCSTDTAGTGRSRSGRNWARRKSGSSSIRPTIPIQSALHLVRFQVLDRQPFDVPAGYLNAWGRERPGEADPIAVEPFLSGARTVPPPYERGWKDTVRADPGEVVRIIARFEGYTGKYPWHYHMLEHEDNEMMLQFEVVP